MENDWGYHKVFLYKNGIHKNLRVHRLIALTFIDNPLDKKQVNHKDLNKKNNNIENLEYVTGQENINHAVKNGVSFVNKIYR